MTGGKQERLTHRIQIDAPKGWRTYLVYDAEFTPCECEPRSYMGIPVLPVAGAPKPWRWGERAYKCLRCGAGWTDRPFANGEDSLIVGRQRAALLV